MGGISPSTKRKTLRAVVDWSWDLLDQAERALLRRLPVFAGAVGRLRLSCCYLRGRALAEDSG